MNEEMKRSTTTSHHQTYSRRAICSHKGAMLWPMKAMQGQWWRKTLIFGGSYTKMTWWYCAGLT